MFRKLKITVLISVVFLSCGNAEAGNSNEKSRKMDNSVRKIEKIAQNEEESCKILSRYSLDSKKIEIRNSGLNEISCIENYRNLEELDLRWNEIKDLEPLRNLKKLKILRINFNKIDDISPVLSLTNLEELWLHNNKIENVDGIEKLKNLKHLDLSFNPIRLGIERVSELKKLKRLELREAPAEVADYVYSNYKNFMHLDRIYIVKRNTAGSGSQFSDFYSKIHDFEIVKTINEVKMKEISENSVPDTVKKEIAAYNSSNEEEDNRIEGVEVYKNGQYSLYGLHYPPEYAGKSSYATLFLKNGKIIGSDMAYVTAQLESIDGNNLYLAYVAAPGEANFLLADFKSGNIWHDEYRDFHYPESAEISKRDRSNKEYRTYSKDGYVNVREGSSAENRIIHKLKNNISVQELYSDKDWRYVYFYNTEGGYMMKGYIHGSQLK